MINAHELALTQAREALEARMSELDSLKSAHELALACEAVARERIQSLTSAHELREGEREREREREREGGRRQRKGG
jgi:hypothetical protein